MDCREIENHLIDYIDGNLDKKTSERIKAHIEECPDCTLALENLQKVLLSIENEEDHQPDASMRIDFEAMLQKEKEALENSGVVSIQKRPNNSLRTLLQIAATIALVFSAYFYGKNQTDESFSNEIAMLEKEKMEMKETMTISLIENESASKRLQAVNYAEEFEKPGNDILKALINKMYYDDHINVRLAAAEALVKFSDSEMVRKALISALDTEEDPGMQIELIQILVSIQEKRAIPSMEKLLQKEATPDYVKDQVKVGLPSLI